MARRISIIIPAYNVEEYIEETLLSALLSADDNTEIIVINDGSTDNTEIIINHFLHTHEDKRICFVSQKNQGVSIARNEGIKNSTGDYFVFCDGDDKCHPDMITKIREQISGTPDMIIWGFDSYTTSRDEYSVVQSAFPDIDCGERLFQAFLKGEVRIRLGSFAVHRRLYDERNVQFTPKCPLSQDVEYILKCLSWVKTVRTINGVFFTYIKHEGSVMFRYNLNRFEAPRTMLRSYEYIMQNTTRLKTLNLDDYMHNTFILKHAIYSFDAIIPYIRSMKDLKSFWNDYYFSYGDVEKEIMRISKEISEYPNGFNELKCKLFLFSRKLYLLIFVVRNNKRA